MDWKHEYKKSFLFVNLRLLSFLIYTVSMEGLNLYSLYGRTLIMVLDRPGVRESDIEFHTYLSLIEPIHINI